MSKTVGMCLAIVLAMSATLLIAPAQARAADDPWQQVLKRDFGTGDDAMKAIRDEVEAATPDKRPALEAKLITVLESADATMAAKQFACRMLRFAGSTKCIPAVAKLLTDEKLSQMGRWVLQGIADPAAEKVLIEAMGKTVGKVRVGIIETLGERRSQTSLAPLARLLGDSDRATVEGVLKAIGKIGGSAGADVVEKAKVIPAAKAMWCDTMLICARDFAAAGHKDRGEKMIRTVFGGDNPSVARAAALALLIEARKLDAMPLIMTALKAGDRKVAQAAAGPMIQMPGKAATQAFAKQMPSLPKAGKIVVLNVIGARGDKAVSQAVNKMVADSDAAVRMAAIGALAKVGDADSVDVLAGRLTDSAEARAATEALATIKADGDVAAMLNLAETAPARVRTVMFDVLARRRAAEAVPLAYKAASDPDAGVRGAAVGALGTLGAATDVPKLAEMMLACKDEARRGQLARALSATAIRTKQTDAILAALTSADDAAKIELVGILGSLQGDKALAVLKDALGSSNIEVKQSAVSALKGWRDKAPMADLLTIARTDADAKCKILALQGYINMIGKIKSERDRIEACKTALDLASRPDEKRLALSVLGGVRDVKALELAVKYMDASAVKNEAIAAGGRIALDLAGKHPDKARPVLERFVKSSKDRRMVRRARQALDKIKKSQTKPKSK